MLACRLHILGSGGSMGVPVVGCHCDVCSSTSFYNKRLRPSAWIRRGGGNILIDAGPDFRFQALRAGIEQVDAVIFTHDHHDHTAGLDDLRIFTLRSGSQLPCLMSQETLHDLKKRFYYVFEELLAEKKLTTNLAVKLLPGLTGRVAFEGLKVDYVTYQQGRTAVNGLRFGEMAYITDIKCYDEAIFDVLQGVKILVLSALRFTPAHLHFTVDDAVEFAEHVGAEQVWLTHIGHELDHDKVNGYLPPHVRLAYDGLEFDFFAEEAE